MGLPANRTGLFHPDLQANPDYKGVCHVALAQEGHCKPGEVLFGTDSHTCNAGAFGQFATGVGNTDAGFILGTGKLLVKVCVGRGLLMPADRSRHRPVLPCILVKLGPQATLQSWSLCRCRPRCGSTLMASCHLTCSPRT